MNVDFGLGLLFGPPKTRRTQWLDVLDASLPALTGHFRSLWMTDHFFWHDEPTFEAMTALTFLASHFPTFEIGPMVLGQNYRNPALLAQMSATLQTLSGGRFIMGIGAGWKEDEYRAYNYSFPPPRERVEQLEETIQVFKQLWTRAGPVTFTGKHYRVTAAWCEPKPDPLPPIMVGGSGVKTMLVAAKHADWWNMSDANPAAYAEKLSTLKRHCESIGRDPATLRPTWFGRLAVGRTQAEAEARAATRALSYTTENALVGTPAQIVDQIGAFRALGVSYFMVDVIGLPDPAVIQMVTEDVIAVVRRDAQ
jgi:alkanesulfonate monooxygenase SsuD/methylene tetrahydromethanopterin reductase-like flavin-dependent oxidoreductase (luciferase family)